jgi:hypothetical protein
MADSEYYRREAKRCLDFKQAAQDSMIAHRWYELAEEYISLAESLDAARGGRSRLMRASTHQQPMQQQQSKSDGQS